MQDFEQRLRGHLLSRFNGVVDIGDETEYTADQLNDLVIHKDTIYTHATATLNYTTYDVRRGQDTINVNTQRRDIMLRSQEDGANVHPYWYARVMGVYHCNVYRRNQSPDQRQRIDVLFVRWFGIRSSARQQGGPAQLRLTKIGFVPLGHKSGAFGFLDPNHVLRACHLAPVFAAKRTNEFLPVTSAYADSIEGDWYRYYVMRYTILYAHEFLNFSYPTRFSDRDLMMRYFGLAVGHRNPADFPVEFGKLREDVLVDNASVPWEDSGATGGEPVAGATRRLGPMASPEPESESDDDDDDSGDEDTSDDDDSDLDYSY